mmetsp:Transcript_37254/g.92732  ORF Transcript_37254/g.92732 Transcript_37254/m.92732 type:complete len:226 (-) Transcript_37254:695-1372(-)
MRGGGRDAQCECGAPERASLAHAQPQLEPAELGWPDGARAPAGHFGHRGVQPEHSGDVAGREPRQRGAHNHLGKGRRLVALAEGQHLLARGQQRGCEPHEPAHVRCRIDLDHRPAVRHASERTVHHRVDCFQGTRLRILEYGARGRVGGGVHRAPLDHRVSLPALPTRALARLRDRARARAAVGQREDGCEQAHGAQPAEGGDGCGGRERLVQLDEDALATHFVA